MDVLIRMIAVLLLLVRDLRVEGSQFDNGYNFLKNDRPRDLVGDDERHSATAQEKDVEHFESPSHDPCKSDGGTFGNTGDDVPIVTVPFTYGVVTNKTAAEAMNATLSDQLQGAENTMLDLAITSMFVDCEDSTGRLLGATIFAEKDNAILNFHIRRNEAEETGVVGISSSPADLPNGEKCTGALGGNEDCNIIEGRLSVYLSDSSYANDVSISTSKMIETMMGNGLLDSCHPAILSVEFLGGPHTEEVIARKTDDDVDVISIEPISPTSDGSTWLIAAGVGIGLIAAITGGRYMYTRNRKEATDDDLDSFEEIDSTVTDPPDIL